MGATPDMAILAELTCDDVLDTAVRKPIVPLFRTGGRLPAWWISASQQECHTNGELGQRYRLAVLQRCWDPKLNPGTYRVDGPDELETPYHKSQDGIDTPNYSRLNPGWKLSTKVRVETFQAQVSGLRVLQTHPDYHIGPRVCRI